jgi:hypothetical protein
MPHFNKKIPGRYPCIFKTPPKVAVNAAIEPRKGQGLGSTK